MSFATLPLCDECGKDDNVFEDDAAGYYVCKRCARVIGNRIIDETSEWRTFENTDGSSSVDPNRVGSAVGEMTMESDMFTQVEPGFGTEFGKWQNRNTMTAHERSVHHAFQYAGKLGARLNLTQNVVDICKELYKKVDDTRKLRSRKIELVVTACLVLACRQANVPRSFKEIMPYVDVPKRDLTRAFNKVKEALASLNENKQKPDVPVAATRSFDLTSRICSALELNQHVKNVAFAIAKGIEEIGCADGKAPQTIASVAVFMASQLHPLATEHRSYKDIATAAHIADGTIKNTYMKHVYPVREELWPYMQKDIERFGNVDSMTLKNLPPS